MNQNDILELTLFQRLFDTVEVRNVLHYKVTAIGALDEVGLATAFSAEVMTDFVDMQSTGIVHYKMTVLNLTDNLGWADVDIIPDQPGVVAGADCPPFTSYAFRKNRGTRTTRSGQLRIAGVPEGASEEGVIITAFKERADILAASLSGPIADGTGGSYGPRIASKNSDGSLRIANSIDSVEFVSITTQNSRKYGRGI